MKSNPRHRLQHKTRNQHISQVLYALQEESSLSRAELSRRTGLAKSSMSSIIDEMLTLGFLQEQSPKIDGVGKPSTQLVLNVNCRGAIGMEINPGFVAVILTDLTGTIRWEGVAPIEPGSLKETYLIEAEFLINQAVTHALKDQIRLLGISVGVPGSVDLKTGTILSSSSLRWTDVRLQHMWEEQFHLPVVVDTVANLGAIGEHLYGCAQDIDTFLYINQSFGFYRSIGLAMMLDGKLWRGNEGRSGRIGHMVIDPSGPLCDCGQRGCWRVMTSDEAELSHAIAGLRSGRQSVLQNFEEDEYKALTVDDIHIAASQGDDLSREVLKRRLEYTELAISNLINIFDPGVVITAYSFTTINKPEVDEIMENLGGVVDVLLKDISLNLNASRRHARNGTNAVLLGAASMLLVRFINDPKGTE